MPDYDVWWGMRVSEVFNARDAAEKAQFIMRGEDHNWLFKVVDCVSGKTYKVDLDDGIIKPYDDDVDE